VRPGAAADDRIVAVGDEGTQILSLARPLGDSSDLAALVDQLGSKRWVCLGEASHGTHEYYRWRAELSRQLIERNDVSYVAVEGDWPDCWRIDRWVRGLEHQSLDARELLGAFHRWPTWMWANEEVADFITWLRSRNLTRPEQDRTGFYGIDVYSLWDSLREIFAWLDQHQQAGLAAAQRAWRCFAPYGEEPYDYATASRLAPLSCEPDVVDLLVDVRRRALSLPAADDAAFGAVQNAEIVAGAERYYRVMLRGDRQSWNIRDRHMVDTVDRLSDRAGPRSRALIWAHNTHVGDARATDMASAGMFNVGQLLRQRHGLDEVALVGFAGHRGGVIAAGAWGAPERVLELPAAEAGSHEDLLHRVLGRPAVLVFGDDRSGPWLASRRGHRAVGVVYQPRHEHGNYVPTVMGARYDALVWFEETVPLWLLHHEARSRDTEFETEPTGF